MKRILFLFFTLTFFQVAVKAQPTLFQINGSPLDTIFCHDSCMAVTSDHLWVKQTNSYTSQSIPYAPINMGTGKYIGSITR